MALDVSERISHEMPSLVAHPELPVPSLSLEPPTPALIDTVAAKYAPSLPVDQVKVDAPLSLDGLQDLGSSDAEEWDEASAQNDAEDWTAMIKEAEDLFTDEQVEAMIAEVKEIGMVNFLRKYYIEQQMSARQLLYVFGVLVPLDFEDEAGLLRILKMSIGRVLRKRAKLSQYNTIQDAVQLIHQSKRILVLTGAGVSTSCGIPDFRSANGIYATLKRTRSDLMDPQEMFDIDFFKHDPTIFYSFAKELYPSNFVPSPSHRFVKLLEDKNKLLRNYTQNIDTLEQAVGVKKVLNCHGSFAAAACIQCGYKVAGDSIKDDIFASRVPLCPVCITKPEYHAAELKRRAPRPSKKQRTSSFSANWDDDDADSGDEDVPEWYGKPVMKPTITFFGEKLSDEFDQSLINDRDEVDLLIVIGTSLKVAPVSEILGHLPHSIPQILINRDPIQHANFDICLLGDCDSVVEYLCQELNALNATDDKKWSLYSSSLPKPISIPRVEDPIRLGTTHVYLFEGANRMHKWITSQDPNYVRPSKSRSPSVSSLSVPGRRPSPRRSGSVESLSGNDSDGSVASDSGKKRKRSASQA